MEFGQVEAAARASGGSLEQRYSVLFCFLFRVSFFFFFCLLLPVFCEYLDL